jgi:hypothetical protein
LQLSKLHLYSNTLSIAEKLFLSRKVDEMDKERIFQDLVMRFSEFQRLGSAQKFVAYYHKDLESLIQVKAFYLLLIFQFLNPREIEKKKEIDIRSFSRKYRNFQLLNKHLS